MTSLNSDTATNTGFRIGIIGGSGLYDIPGLTDQHWQAVESSFGDPSDSILLGTLNGVDLAFLPRHGRGHHLPPNAINYRANIDALKRLNVGMILSISAAGSLREDLPPGTFVIIDQFIDRSMAREKSFFGPGCVAHVSMAHPVSAAMGDHTEDVLESMGIAHHRGGTYLVIDGPQFSSRAESELYRSWGCDVIGMTNMPEAKLAREAEIAYATVAMVTDYDCWHPDHDAVTVEAVVAILQNNAQQARDMISHLVPRLAKDVEACRREVERVLDVAIITPPQDRDPALVARLSAVAGRVLDQGRTDESR